MGKLLLVVGCVYPEPNGSAAGSRMLQLMRLFKEYGYEIIFATSSTPNANSYDLGSENIKIHPVVLNDDSFNDFIKNLNPSVVLFDRFMTEEQFGWRVAQYSPDSLRILDTEDLHFLRKARTSFTTPYDQLQKQLFNSTHAKREIASILRSDLSLIISEYEMKILRDMFNISNERLYYLPFLLESHELSFDSVPNNFQERCDFIHIGNFLHPPNAAAVNHLHSSLWPCIRKKLPQAKIHIYGAHMNENFKAMNKPDLGFLVHGYTDSLADVLQSARVLLAPLKQGAGLKGKLIDAMRHGTPCVMSPIAAEGMFDQKINGLIAENDSSFCSAAVHLYKDLSMWQRSRSNGFDTLKSRFSKSIFASNFMQTISNYIATLEKIRVDNFMGTMLQYHTLNSSKYMGRWITLKNSM